MALFDNKGKKEPIAPSANPTIPIKQDVTPAPSGVPFDQVNNMKQQGMTENQIIQTLQRDGYQSYQIFDAMNQAGLKSASSQPSDQIEPYPQASPEPQLQPQQDFQPQTSPPPQQEYPNFQSQQMSMQNSQPGINEGELDRMEEIAEAIIDEKWAELMKNIKKIIDWKERVETRLEGIEKQIDSLKESMDGINNSLLQRMGEYDRNMTSVGTDVKAMEKVFQKMLPTFTENISELNRITKNMKNK